MKPYILLVEDSPKDVEIISSLLNEVASDSEVVVMSDGEAALDHLRSAPPPVLILLDIKMPKVNGLEVLKAVKSDPKLQAVPVVLLSSSRAEQDLATAYEHRADGYLIKPVRAQQLASAITSASHGT